MIKITSIKMPPGYKKEALENKILKLLRIKKVKSWKILKQSLDCRKHNEIHYEIAAGVFVDNEEQIVRKLNNKNIMLTNEGKYVFPHILSTDVREFLDINQSLRPVIIGSGPAGYHAAVKLAQAGFKPIVLERGEAVENRNRSIEEFWNSGDVDENSNVCFGEGGAGTFSDGKLNTGNKDKGGYFKEVLETFVKYGADESILYMAKPHLGTDNLKLILVNMREDIIRLGGDIRFGELLTDIDKSKENGFYKLSVKKLLTDEVYELITPAVILAIGHSARDTYEMLYDKGFVMEQKPFAMGVRVEHKADTINKAMYGEDYKSLYGASLPTADYKLIHHTESGRSVFSFCMCPGGYVVNSSTEKESICINGMSYSGRNGQNSNSAIVVNIEPADYKDTPVAGNRRVLAGCEFQRKLERKAFITGKGSIPVQLYKDFADHKCSDSIGSIKPEIKGAYNLADLGNVLPEYVYEAILDAMPAFGKRIKGYDDPDTVMSAIEARTSSPIRINRNKEFMSEGFQGIFPAGEGAGYAGGITSAAADGIKCAEALSEYLADRIIDEYMNYENNRYRG